MRQSKRLDRASLRTTTTCPGLLVFFLSLCLSLSETLRTHVYPSRWRALCSFLIATQNVEEYARVSAPTEHGAKQTTMTTAAARETRQLSHVTAKYACKTEILFVGYVRPLLRGALARSRVEVIRRDRRGGRDVDSATH